MFNDLIVLVDYEGRGHWWHKYAPSGYLTWQVGCNNVVEAAEDLRFRGCLRDSMCSMCDDRRAWKSHVSELGCVRNFSLTLAMLVACLSSAAAPALWLPGLGGGTGCCGVIVLDRSPALGTGYTGCTWPTEENTVFLNTLIPTVFHVLYTKRRSYLFKGLV